MKERETAVKMNGKCIKRQERTGKKQKSKKGCPYSKVEVKKMRE